MENGPFSRLTYTLALFSVILVIAMVLYPDVAFNSAVRGLKIWWEVVFPALLPFFIGSQVLMGLGVVHFMGVMLEPMMRPLFNVPGTGSFVLAMGLASGYPIGSVLTAQLRRQGLVSKTEAERLMSFTNTADPLFMSGAVAVGMFGLPAASGVIMAAHYLSSLLTGLVLKFYRRHQDQSPPVALTPGNVLRRALEALRDARIKDGRPFGQLLGDAVRQSVDTLLLVGGFIILFSVIIQMLGQAGLVGYAANGVKSMLAVVGLNQGLSLAVINGFFEITLGTQLAGQAAAPLAHRLMVASAVIAWSGLSVHAQVAAMIQGTDIDLKPYLFGRVFHSLTAGTVTALLLAGPMGRVFSAPAVTVSPLAPGSPLAATFSWTARLGLAGLTFSALALTLLALGIATSLLGTCRGPSHR